MKEIREIIKSFEQASKLGKKTALATVVHVEGSSYRRAGARMLITEDGQLTGAISGGCLEGDALRKALLVISQQRSMVVTYDTMDDDDAKFGVGLGCNGIIQVLIEPLNSLVQNNPIHYLKAVAEQRQRSVLVTLFSLTNKQGPQPGTCLMIREDGTSLQEISLPVDGLVEDARQVFGTGHSYFKNYVSSSSAFIAFIELVNPAVSLVIAGAGNDAQPLVEMAAILGWETTVVDGRASYASQARFPNAGRILVSKPKDILQQIPIDSYTVFVLMTHNYNYDMAVLRQLLDRGVVYVGMLGPKKKLERILAEWKDEGIQYSKDQLSIIHSPVGLDIGAETSEEIALCILAEIKAVLTGKHAEFLTHLQEPIHPRSTAELQSKD